MQRSIFRAVDKLAALRPGSMPGCARSLRLSPEEFDELCAELDEGFSPAFPTPSRITFCGRWTAYPMPGADSVFYQLGRVS